MRWNQRKHWLLFQAGGAHLTTLLRTCRLPLLVPQAALHSTWVQEALKHSTAGTSMVGSYLAWPILSYRIVNILRFVPSSHSLFRT